VQIQQNIPLAPLTTLRIGGPARFFARATSEEDLLAAAQFARDQNLPVFVLGSGSNLLVADSGFAGLVIQVALGDEIAWTADRTCLEVSAGLDWDKFVEIVCEQGIGGLECLAGIPGLVGASPVQNIGAYGQEVSQTIASVRALDLSASRLDDFAFMEMPAWQLGFRYRSSIFNTIHRHRYIVTRVDFKLEPGKQPTLSYADLAPLRGTNPTPLEVAVAVRRIRAAKGMYLDPADPSPDHRSAGSFFKNPVVPQATLTHIAQTLALAEDKIPHWPVESASESESRQLKLPAAWLIEQAGFPKGFSLGPVGISSRHTLALINRSGHASCADLLRLRDTITQEVTRRFRVELEQEPVLLG
jgi:UDP-N-acetylmuramate dehydrogenase